MMIFWFVYGFLIGSRYLFKVCIPHKFC